MKIAIIGSRGIHSSYGGIERVLAKLCPRIAALGHQIDVFSEEAPADAPEYPGVRSITVGSIPGKYTETISRAAFATAKAMAGGYDVINYVAIGSGILSAVPRLTRTPVVVSIHGLDWRRNKWPGPARLALKGAERMIVSQAKEITVVSRELQDYFRDTYAREVVYTPNGIDIREGCENEGLLGAMGLEGGKFLLFASRLVEEKAAHELIEAFNDVDTDLKLAIAGGGRYDQEYVDRLKTLDRSGRVVFTGHLTGPALDAVFAGARLYVLPSHVEGLSLSLLEAMGFGKATLVSDIAENLEVVGDSGFTFPVGDVPAMTKAITDILSSPAELDAMGEKAREHARKLYSWDAIAREYSDLYTRLGTR